VALDRLLAALNTSLVTGSVVAIVAGYRAIRRRQGAAERDRSVRRHKRAMLGAFGLSAAFLVTFVFRYVRFGRAEFHGRGALRLVYSVVWFTHEPIAVVSVPLVIAAILLGLRGRFASHRELANVALPLWLYSALTGIALYVILYFL
jgi:putative membrane protein